MLKIANFLYFLPKSKFSLTLIRTEARSPSRLDSSVIITTAAPEKRISQNPLLRANEHRPPRGPPLAVIRHICAALIRSAMIIGVRLVCLGRNRASLICGGSQMNSVTLPSAMLLLLYWGWGWCGGVVFVHRKMVELYEKEQRGLVYQGEAEDAKNNILWFTML